MTIIRKTQEVDDKIKKEHKRSMTKEGDQEVYGQSKEGYQEVDDKNQEGTQEVSEKITELT